MKDKHFSTPNFIKIHELLWRSNSYQLQYGINELQNIFVSGKRETKHESLRLLTENFSSFTQHKKKKKIRKKIQTSNKTIQTFLEKLHANLLLQCKNPKKVYNIQHKISSTDLCYLSRVNPNLHYDFSKTVFKVVDRNELYSVLTA